MATIRDIQTAVAYASMPQLQSYPPCPFQPGDKVRLLDTSYGLKIGEIYIVKYGYGHPAYDSNGYSTPELGVVLTNRIWAHWDIFEKVEDGAATVTKKKKKAKIREFEVGDVVICIEYGKDYKKGFTANVIGIDPDDGVGMFLDNNGVTPVDRWYVLKEHF